MYVQPLSALLLLPAQVSVARLQSHVSLPSCTSTMMVTEADQRQRGLCPAAAAFVKNEDPFFCFSSETGFFEIGFDFQQWSQLLFLHASRATLERVFPPQPWRVWGGADWAKWSDGEAPYMGSGGNGEAVPQCY